MDEEIKILFFAVGNKDKDYFNEFLTALNWNVELCRVDQTVDFPVIDDKPYDFFIFYQHTPCSFVLEFIKILNDKFSLTPICFLFDNCNLEIFSKLHERKNIAIYPYPITDYHTIVEKIKQFFFQAEKENKCRENYELLKNREWEIASILENISEGYIRTDSNSLITLVNQSGLNILGYSTPEKLLGKHIVNLYESAEEREGILTQLQQQNHLTDRIIRFLHSDGSLIWVSANIRYNCSPLGEFLGTEATFRDISEKLERENELELKEQLLESSFDSIMLIDMHGKMIFANKNAYETRGYTQEEFLNININDLILDKLNVDFQKLKNDLEGMNVLRFETIHKKKDGTIFNVNAKVRRLNSDAYRLYLVSCEDITEHRKTRNALIDSELRLRDLMESSPIGFLTTDKEGIITYTNSILYRIFGFEPTFSVSFIGKKIKDLPGINIPELTFLASQVANGSVINDNEITVFRVNGAICHLQVSALPLKDNAGIISGFLYIFHDITQQYNVEAELRENREQYSSLAESSNDPIYLVDKNCRFLFANKSYLKRVSVELEKLVGEEYRHFHTVDDYEEFQHHVKVVFETGKWVEYEHSSKRDGQIFLRTINPVFNPISGIVDKVTIVSKDITERKKVEEELAKERNLLKTLIEILPNAVFAKDINYRKFILNSKHIESVQGHLHHLGIKSDVEILGKTDFDVFPSEWASVFHEEDKKVIEKGESVINNLELGADRNGETIWNLVSKMPLSDANGEIIGMVGITTDITKLKEAEEKLLEQNALISKLNQEYIRLNKDLIKTNDELLISQIKAEESDKLKTIFLQNMSHEIRTPMNAIMGFSELLQMDLDKPDKIESYSKIIYQRSNDLLDIINGILDISKIESGQLPVKIEEFSILPVFSELETTFQEYSKKMNKAHISFSVKNNCKKKDIIIHTDKVKLKQIFINLIGNAFKFTENGEIEAGCLSCDHRGLVYYVKDTGIGIPKEKQTLVFDRFMQVSDNPLSTRGGSGLGLSIVRGLVKLLGGEIWLESEPDKGSNFYFTIADIAIPSE